MKKLLIGAALAALGATSASATLLYGVDEQNNLVSFKASTPGTFLTDVAITGTSATMLALDFRPNNKVLYGLGDDLRLYTINTSTGIASAVNAAPLALMGTNFGFDFNPTIDRIRIVSNSGQNYVINPITGTIQLVATPVGYAGGDPNAGKAANVTAVAYTPSAQTGNTADSQLYAIDSAQDVLAKLANNTGVLTTVGATGVNFGPRDSFDISFGGLGFAVDAGQLYSVDLTTGGLSLIGATERTVFGLSAAVPEPATWAMMIAGFGLVGGVMRRRAKVNVAYA